MKTSKPRRPHGRWVYYILYDGILWPCPVRWEWESDYGGWLPLYYAPTFEFIVGDPAKASRIGKTDIRHGDRVADHYPAGKKTARTWQAVSE